MSNKLIILGNGFDLQCGLESSFSSFFVKSELEVCKNWYARSGRKNLSETSFISLLLYNTYFRENFTFNDYFNNKYLNINYKEIFQKKFKLSEKLVNWMDVESFLNAILQKDCLEFFSSTYQSVISGNYEKNYCVCVDDGLNDYFVLKCTEVNMIDFNAFLMKELKLFEKRFVEFLKKEIELHKDYFQNSNAIFDCFVDDYDVGTILNFNYTHICNKKQLNEINIHGSIENNIIIGIDILNENYDATQFTKTFRKLYYGEETHALKSDIDEIIIYGHSLGAQDYSYFQSIFDYINLYSCNTVLRFLYSDNFFKEGSIESLKTKRRIDFTRDVINLINTYGKTMSNKDNGKNLVHKLMLEGRLKIELKNFN